MLRFLSYHIFMEKGEPKMKILILTAKFGQGHVSASRAIRAQIVRQHPEAEIHIVDLMPYIYPHSYPLIYTGFNYLVNSRPGIYNSLAKIDALTCQFPWRTRVRHGLAIQQLVTQYNPDLILSTWLMSSKYVSSYKKYFHSKIPFVTCITDIGAYPEWIADYTDAYLVGSEYTAETLRKSGVNPRIIYVGGIPVNPQFEQTGHTDPSSGTKNILVMGGGLGILPGIDALLHALQERPEFRVTVITGHNRELYRHLKQTYPGIQVIGFTDQVPMYMQNADLILTKAGGLTLSEAIHSETPIFVLDPFFQHERENAEYIQREQIGGIIESGSSAGIREFVDEISSTPLIQDAGKNMHRIREKYRGNEINSIMDDLRLEA